MESHDNELFCDDNYQVYYNLYDAIANIYTDSIK